MLFAEPFNLQNIMPWVIVALAVVMLVTILGKCVSIYRNIKKNRTYVKREVENTQQLLSIRGEYLVLNSGVEYSVGEDGQLKAGKYLLRGDGYDKFQIAVNGEIKQYNGDSSAQFVNGDVISPVTCAALIKPIADEKEQL